MPDPDDFGVVYFVDENPKYREMLEMSQESLRRFHPDWPVKVLCCPSAAVPIWKQAYRAVSFWRWQRRQDRCGQDRRVFVRKAHALLDAPFERTLFLDVDTVVTRPLDGLRRESWNYDAIFNPLPWKAYPKFSDELPESIPFIMSGVFVYSRRFAEVCRPYVERYGDRLHEIVDGTLLGDQFVFSLVCVNEADHLRIAYDPRLQLDVINAAQHLGTAEFPRIGKCIDITWEGLRPFSVFHYNEHKPQYMAQIRAQWQREMAGHEVVGGEA